VTTRLQVLRSSTTGNLPAAGARLPGELWTNFPDLQLGVIDAARNAQKLVAVRYFSTTANYAAGDFVVQAGVLYVAKGAVTAGAFNPAQWTQIAAATDPNGPYLPIAGGTLTGALVLAADPGAALGAATKQYVDGKVTAAPFLPLAGGTMTGLVTLSGPPTIPLHAATKAYVDSGAFVPIAGGTMTGPLVLAADPAAAMNPVTLQYLNAHPMLGDNRIINGDMRIDQRNNGASGTAQGYTVDRWYYSASQTGKGQWQRQSGGVAPVSLGFPYYLTFTSTSAYTPLAADNFSFQQRLEGDAISDFAWGTANAQPVTLSFWISSTLTGMLSGAFTNYTGTRSYPFTFQIPTVSAWSKIVLTIPGDTAGTWVTSGNAGGLLLSFDLGNGANNRGPAGAWASANYLGATGAINIVGTNGAIFILTGVKLEVGSVATSYNRQSLAKSLADCQRYYQVGNFGLQGNAAATATTVGCEQTLAVVMRATPTMVVASETSSTNMAARSIAPDSPSHIRPNGSATNVFSWTGTFTASAEL
jgi:hypothetical protein